MPEPPATSFADDLVRVRTVAAPAAAPADDFASDLRSVRGQADFTSSNELDPLGHSVVRDNDPGVLRGVVDSLDFISPLIKGYRQVQIEAAQKGEMPPDPVEWARVQLLRGVASAHWNQVKESVHAGQEGHALEAVAHGLAALLPGVGPMAAKAGEDIASGRPRYGVGEAVGTLLPFGAKAAGELRSIRPIAPNVNAAEAAAVEFGVSRGIPVDAATASGRWPVKGAQALIDRSLGGAVVADRARQVQGDAFARVGSELADEAHPAPIVPTQAGEGVRGAVSDLIDRLHQQANSDYDKLREFGEDPSRSMRMPTAPAGSAAERAIARKIADGLETDKPPTPDELHELHRIVAEMESVPFTSRTWNWREGETGVGGNAAGGHADIVGGSAGAPVYNDILQAAPGTSNMTRGDVVRNIRSMLEEGTVTNAGRGALEVARARLAGSSAVSRPILPPSAGDVAHPLGRLESMGLPVDVTAAKKVLRPIADQLHRQLPLTQAQANPGLKAIDNILNGPDYAPLAQVDRDLSAIKAISRTQGGLAKVAVRHLDQAVRDAATKAGPDVLQALEIGRAATVAKYGAQAVLDKLREEPRQLFDQLTRPKDAAIEQLKAVAELTPTEVPKIGRAVLEDLLTEATAEGGFQKAASRFVKWRSLGSQTKEVLFPDHALRQNLDHFFLLAKRAADNPNPSGTAHLAGLGVQGAYVFVHPLTGVPMEIGAAALAKLLRSPVAVRALTKGFSIQIGNKPAAVAAFSQIMKVAGDDVVPLSRVAEDRDQPPAKVGRR